MSHERFLDVHQKYVQWAEKITLPPWRRRGAWDWL